MTTLGNESSVKFTNMTLKHSGKFLFNNCFFKLGSKVLQQIIRIPVEWDPAQCLCELVSQLLNSQVIRNFKKLMLQGLDTLEMF